MSQMTDFEINEILNRCNRASPSPWISYVEGRDHDCGSSFIMTGTTTERGEDIELMGATIDDQDFIAHARQDIPNLLQEIIRLRKLTNH